MNPQQGKISFKKRINKISQKKRPNSSCIIRSGNYSISSTYISGDPTRKKNLNNSNLTQLNNSLIYNNTFLLPSKFNSINVSENYISTTNLKNKNTKLLYEDSIKLKTKINKLKKELALAKSDNRKKEEEIKKREKAIENAKKKLKEKNSFGDLKEENIIIKLKDNYQILKSKIKKQVEENNKLENEIKQLNINQLEMENFNNMMLLQDKINEYNNNLQSNINFNNELNLFCFNKKEFINNHSYIKKMQKKLEEKSNKVNLMRENLEILKDKLNQIEENRKRIESYNESIKKYNEKLLIDKKKRDDFILKKPIILGKINEYEAKAKNYEEKNKKNENEIEKIDLERKKLTKQIKDSEISKPIDYDKLIYIEKNPNENINHKILLLESLIQESKDRQNQFIEIFLYYDDYVRQKENYELINNEAKLIEEKNIFNNNLNSNNNFNSSSREDLHYPQIQKNDEENEDNEKNEEDISSSINSNKNFNRENVIKESKKGNLNNKKEENNENKEEEKLIENKKYKDDSEKKEIILSESKNDDNINNLKIKKKELKGLNEKSEENELIEEKKDINEKKEININLEINEKEEKEEEKKDKEEKEEKEEKESEIIYNNYDKENNEINKNNDIYEIHENSQLGDLKENNEIKNFNNNEVNQNELNNKKNNEENFIEKEEEEENSIYKEANINNKNNLNLNNKDKIDSKKKGEIKSFKLILSIIFWIKNISIEAVKEKYNNLLNNLKEEKDIKNILLNISKEILNLINDNNESDIKYLNKTLSYLLEEKYKNNKNLFLIKVIDDLISKNKFSFPENEDEENQLLGKLIKLYSGKAEEIIQKLNEDKKKFISYKNLKKCLKEKDLYNKNDKDKKELFKFFIYVLKKNSSNSNISIFDFILDDIISFFKGISDIINDVKKYENNQNEGNEGLSITEEELDKIINKFLKELNNFLEDNKLELNSLLEENKKIKIKDEKEVEVINIYNFIDTLNSKEFNINDNFTISCIFARYQFDENLEDINLNLLENDLKKIKL